MPETGLQEILVNHYKAEILSYMDRHPDAFEKAIWLALDKDSPFSWRASWILGNCMHENDERLQPFVADLIRDLPYVNESGQREWLGILQKMDLKEEFEGFLFDACIGIWEAAGKRPGVRMNAFRMMVKLATKHPDLANEISFLIQEHYFEGLSPGIKRSAERIASPFLAR